MGRHSEMPYSEPPTTATSEYAAVPTASGQTKPAGLSGKTNLPQSTAEITMMPKTVRAITNASLAIR